MGVTRFGRGDKKEKAMMTRTTAATMTTVMAVLLVAAPAAAGVDDYPGQTAGETRAQGDAMIRSDRAWSPLDDVRVSTGRYHDLSQAIEDGFVPFSVDGGDAASCFDGGSGGMGVHYVRGIDGTVDPSAPEAMVYELTPDGQPRLVAVEYIVPQEFVEGDHGEVVSLPRILDQDFHKHPTLPVYVLHAWIWEENPDGPFADFNPNVSECPTV
jgi:hypothetical protein